MHGLRRRAPSSRPMQTRSAAASRRSSSRCSATAVSRRPAIVVRGSEIDVAPVTPASAQVVLGEDLRDLGAAVAVRLVAALGGTVSLDGETLTIRLA